MAEPITELRYRFERWRPARTIKRKAILSVPLGAALPRITRLMALAIRLEDLLQRCPELKSRELACRGHVSGTRITQILNLLNLAPDIQERLLWLPPLVKGREVISEKALRRLAGESHWERQRERFDQLLSRRPGTEVQIGAQAEAVLPT